MDSVVMAEFGTTGPSASHVHHVPMSTTTPSSAGGAFAPSAGSSWSDGVDANTALAELDQGLRCGRIGDQSEAIVRFPRLFAKYPFPILISSSLLKLADVFRQQNSNFLRLCVLRVLEQSERHLDKVSNVDELLKRFVTVIHSNDPTARALTLRALGTLAVIIPERKQVHHSIRNALDSHDSVELQAAIYTAGRFAARSKTFAVNMCSKISEMISGLETPLDRKLKLIPIFQHMYHDAQTAQVVRNTCIEMLPNYPSKEFVVVTLHTLTLLAAHTLVDIPDQVELLLKYLNEDLRRSVKKRILRDLRFLANSDHAHLWSEANVCSLIEFASRCQFDAILCGALSVLCDLVTFTSTDKFALDDANADVLRLCESCCYCSQLAVVARATQLLTLLATSCRRDMHHIDGVDIVSEAILAIEALFLLINSGVTDAKADFLNECLCCVVMLCRAQPDACDRFVDVVGGVLLQSGADTLEPLCRVLAALGDMRRGVLLLLLPDMCSALGGTARQNPASVSLLTTMLFQTMKGCKWSEAARTTLDDAVAAVDNWTCYRIGRSAARYGHMSLAVRLFERAAEAVSSEHLYFWLTGVSQVCRGEDKLLDPCGDVTLVDRLSDANSQILLASSSINAATTPSKNQEFQLQYLRCRSEMLQALLQLVLSCHSLRTSPPPAIASTLARQSHDDLQRCGRIAQLLRKSVNDFKTVDRLFGDMAQSSFDTDADTLLQLQLLQRINSCIAQWIEMVCLRSNLQGAIYREADVEFVANLPKAREECGIVIQDLVSVGERLADIFRHISEAGVQPISHVHTEGLLQAVSTLTASPLCLPRFFFQSLQQTGLKLAVSPQPRAQGEPIQVATSQQFAVKIEGVITRRMTGAASSLGFSNSLRKASAVRVLLQSQLLSPAIGAGKSSSEFKKPMSAADCAQSLEQRAEPHNDFFTAQFLVSFAMAGSYQLTIETEFIDEEERSWKTGGQKTTLLVKAFEDGPNRAAAARAANR